MKNRNPCPHLGRILGILQLVLLSLCSRGQVSVGNWNFNGVLTGTPGANNTVSSASLGSAITTSNYNGGTVFFGEGGWPTAGINLNAYLQFSLTPNVGYALNLSSIDFNIRRSTTGTPPGSGPQTWALRSSLDGYSTDISNGVLTQSTTPTITVALGASFHFLTSGITFRLYGYNSSVSSGGLDRFVYDNITVNGLYVLPVSIDGISGNVVNRETVQLSGAVYNVPEPFDIYVQRSVDLVHFVTIDSLFMPIGDNQVSYIDHHLPNATNIYYRFAINQIQGNWIYSSIILVKNFASENFAINEVTLSGTRITAGIEAGKKTSALLSLISVDGKILRQKNILLEIGKQHIDMEAAASSGIYFLKLDYGSGIVSKEIFR